MIATVLFLTAAIACAEDAPKILSMSPAHGVSGVDPTTDSIRIEFDRDMNGGMSFGRSSGAVPKISGDYAWETPRVLVLPVTLEPNTAYGVALNGSGLTGFRSADGVLLEWAPWHFRTGPAEGGEATWTRTLDEAENTVAIDTLRLAITNRYGYRDRMGIDWDALFAAHADELIRADSPYTFAARVATMLQATDDLHLWVDAEGTRYSVATRGRLQSNANFRLMPELLDDFEQRSKSVMTGRLGDDIAYVSVGSWDFSRQSQIKPAFDAIDEYKDVPAMIIDVRANGGGSEILAQSFASSFVDERVHYASHISVDPASDRFKPMGKRFLEPRDEDRSYDGPVAVLVGPHIMSSGEAFVLMMKAAPNAFLVGAPTYGSSGNPKSIELGNGVTVWLPSWQALRADGTPFEGEGIAPDIEVVTTPGDFEDADPVLERAVAELRERLGT